MGSRDDLNTFLIIVILLVVVFIAVLVVLMIMPGDDDSEQSIPEGDLKSDQPVGIYELTVRNMTRDV